MSETRHPVLGVVGGCGGAGASSLAAAIAARGARDEVWPVLLDLDPLAGGIDVALGAESVEGARWSGIHSDGAPFDPDRLAQGLPRWGTVPFLACDVAAAPAAAAVAAILEAAASLGPVVVDLGRTPTPARSAALARTDLVALVVPASVQAVAAAAFARSALPDRARKNCRLVVRQRRRGGIGPDWAAELLGLPLIGVLPVDRALTAGTDRGIEARRLDRRTIAVARDLMDSAAFAAVSVRPPVSVGRVGVDRPAVGV